MYGARCVGASRQSSQKPSPIGRPAAAAVMVTASAEAQRSRGTLGILTLNPYVKDAGPLSQVKSLRVIERRPRGSLQGKGRWHKDRADPSTLLGLHAGAPFKAALVSKHVECLISDEANGVTARSPSFGRVGW